MTTTNNKQFQSIERLWASGDLDKLEFMLPKFNIFNALKLDNTEIRHSNFLSWLMNPREKHNVGDYFLKEFFKTALNGFGCDPRIGIKPLDIINERFYDCEIRREYNNIDILIINPDSKFLCLIENKIWSGEHSEQLERYAQIVENEFKDYKKLHIFLVPNPDEAILERKCKENENAVYYISVGYEQVVNAIEKTLNHRSSIMSSDVKVFIEHYKEMVERNIMNKIDKETMDFCRALYKQHKEAIDLINECNESVAPEIMKILKEIIDEESLIKNTNSSAEIIFLPSDINNIENFKFGKDKNWLNSSIVGLYFGKTNTGFDFGISLQTAEEVDNPKRRELIQLLEKELDISFQGRGDAWRWKPQCEVISFDEFCDLDAIAAKNIIKERISKTIEQFCESINNYTD